MGLRQQWNWLRQFGSNDDESTEASQQILCCVSSAALGVIRRKGSTRKTRHIELKAFILQQMECATKIELCSGGNERDACRLFDEDTVDTKFGPSVGTRIGDQFQS